MIKRIVGLLAAVAVLAVVVFAILGSGTYSSFIGRAGRSAAAPACVRGFWMVRTRISFTFLTSAEILNFSA